MKQIAVALIGLTVGLGMFMSEADAKRLGGGKSVGMQRDSTTLKQATPPAQPAAPAQQAAPVSSKPTPATAPQPSGARKWLGPIAGLAAGLGLAALASHLGLGEEFASIMLAVLIGVGLLFVLRLLFRRKTAGNLGYAGAGGAGAPMERSAFEPAGGTTPPAPVAARGSIPADFDTEGFVRQAKLNFIRLQAANDTGNLADLREFTTPEVFAEAKLQIEERGGGVQQTDVVTLNGEVLEVSEEGNRYIVTVHFWGSLRESPGSAPEPFDEFWHLTKPKDGSQGWLIAGIQQSH